VPRIPAAAPRDDDAVDVLQAVVGALIAGGEERARALLAPIAGQTRLSHPITPMPTLAPAWRPGTGAKTRNPPKAVIAAVWVRDCFTCSYCCRRTIPANINRLVSGRLGASFGYQKTWRSDLTHRRYWDLSTSLDHIEPVSLGGSWSEVSNPPPAGAARSRSRRCRSTSSAGRSPAVRAAGTV
jgi:hypothetical protein